MHLPLTAQHIESLRTINRIKRSLITLESNVELKTKLALQPIEDAKDKIKGIALAVLTLVDAKLYREASRISTFRARQALHRMGLFIAKREKAIKKVTVVRSSLAHNQQVLAELNQTDV